MPLLNSPAERNLPSEGAIASPNDSDDSAIDLGASSSDNVSPTETLAANIPLDDARSLVCTGDASAPAQDHVRFAEGTANALRRKSIQKSQALDMQRLIKGKVKEPSSLALTHTKATVSLLGQQRRSCMLQRSLNPIYSYRDHTKRAL